jgi:tripartite ATP-independent transporter DctM subunit
MEIGLITILLFCGLLFLLILGVPVAFALGAVTIVFTFILNGAAGLYIVVTTTYKQITDPNLITIPLFLLMGNFLVHSGISEKIFEALGHWVSGIKGGLAIISIGVCVALAMCGGFGPGILTMGLIAVPAMLKQRYDSSLALGSVMAGGVLGEIIPPSIIMIIFAYISRVSIGKLFCAGVIPGLLTALLYITYIIVKCHVHPMTAPVSEERISWSRRISGLKHILPMGALVFVVLGSIFMGMATPAEAAAVGAFGAMAICLAYGRLTREVIQKSCRQTFSVAGMALWILIGATMFSVFYTGAGAQSLVEKIIQTMEINKWVVLIVMQIILLIFGMFMDDYAVVTVCAPIFVPIATGLGFDPIWFSVIFILNMQAAYLSPPFGWALILMKGVAPPDIRTEQIWRSVPPFIIIQVAVLILAMIFPKMALFLPDLMFKN